MLGQTVRHDAMISDLFFNHEHPRFDEFRHNDMKLENFHQERQTALEEDAKEFFDDFKPIMEAFGVESPEDLVEDFFHRL